jgi:metal-dependent amidase/aminoacylase/carboxypeptidase family protein
VQAYSGIALLRQQIAKDESIQGVILNAGSAANLIPGLAEGLFSVRSPTVKRLNELKARVEPIFQGAAAATGCTVDVIW